MVASTDFVATPWGGYLVIGETANSQIKRLEIKPSSRLSDQRHMSRGETWIPLNGILEVAFSATESIIIEQGESFSIHPGTWHRLSNPTGDPLIVVEVQVGPYLGEDDIERRDDDYGRVS